MYLPVGNMSLSIQQSHDHIPECREAERNIIGVFWLGGAPQVNQVETTPSASDWRDKNEIQCIVKFVRTI